MTCRRNPMDPGQALYLAVSDYPGGVPAMASRLHTAASTLYAQLRGSEPMHVSRWREILHYLHEAGRPGWDAPIHALAHEHAGVFMAVGSVDGSETTAALVATVKEFADLASTSAAALSDGHITPTEMAKIEREGYEALRAIEALLLSCRGATA